MNMKLVSVDDVSIKLREPFILAGYRDPAASWGQHFGSLFSIHNEAMNIWTHLIAFIGFALYLCYALSNDLSPLDPDHEPLLLLLISFCLFSFSSAAAHLLAGKTTQVRDCCYFVDYAVISFQAWSSAVAYAAYSPLFLGGTLERVRFFIIVGAISLLCTSVACFSRLGESENTRKPLRLIGLVVPYVLAHIPISYNILMQLRNDGKYSVHLRHISLSCVAVSFYGSHFPERFFPGLFDNWFHSHSIFHILISISAALGILAVSEDCGAQPKSRIKDYSTSCFHMATFMFVAEFFVVLFYSIRVKNNSVKKKDS